MNDALDRRGHLSEWALERVRVDDPASDPAFFAAARAHLSDCPPCAETLRVMDAEAPALTLRPEAAVVPLTPRKRLWAGLGALALAAVVLVIAWPRTAAPPEILAKGTHFDFEVHIKTAEGSVVAADGHVVHPGDRLGFKARAAARGTVVVFGWDDRQAPYPIMAPLPLAPSPETQPLAAAVELDAHGTRETLAAVLCPDAFTLTDVASPPIDEPALFAKVTAKGCTLRLVRLTKRARP